MLEIKSLLPETKVDRRDFLRAGLGVGFAAAAAPVLSQNAIKTDSDGLVVGEVTVPVGNDKIPAYRAKPAKRGTFPTVLVISEIFGVHEYIADVCRRFAKAGYYAIAPELFVRQGDVASKGSVKEVVEIVSKVPDAQVMSDLDACVAFAGGDGGNTARLAITGFCWGGRIVWMYAAHSKRLDAGVAWYGRLVNAYDPKLQPKNPIDIADALHAPVLGLYGGKDEGIPLESVVRMKAALANGTAASKASEFTVYRDAPHAFHADYRPTYRKDAAEDGWQRMLAWFKQHGV
ncbi:MAG TPA: dienelactone hydrolase family protein [Burkholderiaceae bacterium]|nr:dienelactone hydrolase family protein [Burkholderiaceae bacterium]